MIFEILPRQMDDQISDFIDPGPQTRLESVAILHLRRDDVVGARLTDIPGTDSFYGAGNVVTTRFGSFPHSTLIDIPWGSQIRASKVDTGSRGRKRKRVTETAVGGQEHPPKLPLPGASTGFLHIIPPTPEAWTTALSHRTQVVYTPDYSYILHRLGVRPGSICVEAGAGSGSFTHAAARAVFHGTQSAEQGHLHSFEFHEERFHKLKAELVHHRLNEVVSIHHRDVYADGFEVNNNMRVDSVFLDLPSPWLALHHISREVGQSRSVSTDPRDSRRNSDDPAPGHFLNPEKAITICIFSPCIEQVQRAVDTLRDLGWVDIEMVDVSHRKIETRHNAPGIDEHKGLEAGCGTVEDAVSRLDQVEEKFRSIRTGEPRSKKGQKNNDKADKVLSGSRHDRYRSGRLVHRSEAELKTHTSYLIFAVLPVLWTEADEEKASTQWTLETPAVDQYEPMGTADPVGR